MFPLDGTFADDDIRVLVATPTSIAVQRLRTRRDAILAVVGQRFEVLYDRFVDYVNERMQPVLVAHLDEILGMTRRGHDRLFAFLDAAAANPIDADRLEQFISLKDLGGDLNDPDGLVANFFVGWGLDEPGLEKVAAGPRAQLERAPSMVARPSTPEDPVRFRL